MDNKLKGNENVEYNNTIGVQVLKKFPHLMHFVLTLLTGGFWVLIWLTHYMCRDKNKYY